MRASAVSAAKACRPAHRLPEVLEITLPALVREGRQRWMCRRILALPAVVIACNEPAWQPDRLMQAARLGQVAFPARSIQRHVAAVDDKIGTLADEMFSNAGEALVKERLFATQVRVRDLGDAEGHAGSLASSCDTPVTSPSITLRA